MSKNCQLLSHREGQMNKYKLFDTFVHLLGTWKGGKISNIHIYQNQGLYTLDLTNMHSLTNRHIWDHGA
jgi:hypothetical protein